MAKKKTAWKPSEGKYGFLGAHSGSEAGKRNRGKTKDKGAQQVKDAADQALGTLLRQFNRSSGPDSTYQQQMDLETEAAGLAEESFLDETDRQASAIMDANKQQSEAIENQQAKSGFAGSGSTGRAREDLARSIQEKGKAIYGDLSMKMGAQDIEMDKKKLGAETEMANELDRIEGEASGIISQTTQALNSMDKKAVASEYKWKPNPGLDAFKPPDDINLTIG
jgi:hypothetical protein